MNEDICTTTIKRWVKINTPTNIGSTLLMYIHIKLLLYVIDDAHYGTHIKGCNMIHENREFYRYCFVLYRHIHRHNRYASTLLWSAKVTIVRMRRWRSHL